MLNIHLKFALRSLARRKVYTALDIVGLAVGMACAILIMLWVRYEWNYDRFHEQADQLYRVVFSAELNDRFFRGYYQPGPLGAELKRRFPDVAQATNFASWETKASSGERGFLLNGSLADTAFFEMFSFPLVRGDPRSALAGPNSIAISEAAARRLFGSTDAVGHVVRLDDHKDFIVSGVFRDVPPASHMQFDFVIPFVNAPDWMKLWDRKCVQTYVLVRKGCSSEAVSAKIAGVMDEHNPTWKNRLSLVPITRSHLYDLNGGGLIVYLYAFSLLAALVLLVACINFTNLSTARAEKRAREIGIRKAVGSSRASLAFQFLTETMVVTVAALFLAVFLTELLLPFLNNLLGTTIALVYTPAAVAALLALALLTALVAGGYPAWILSSTSPMAMLKKGSETVVGRRSFTLRRILVISQFAFAVFVITCVLLVRKQLSFVQSRELGFDKEHVVLIRASGELQNKLPLVKEALLQSPYVLGASVSATDLTGFRGAGTGPVEWAGMNPQQLLEVGFNFVDEDFAKTFRMTMTRGRFFSREFPSDASDAFVVNEAAVRAMNLANPLGKHLKTWFGREGRIIGVIADFHTESLHQELSPLVLVPTRSAGFLCLRIAPGDVRSAVQAIGAKIRGIVPTDPFEYRFLDATIDNLYGAEQRTGGLATCVAVLAMVLSCLGLVGLIAFATERRTKEIGVRKVVGATVPGICVMLTGDFTLWVIIANIIGWPAAYLAMHAWLQDFAYRIDLTIWPFLAAGVLTLVIAMLVVSVQAIRAATANPVEALRYE